MKIDNTSWLEVYLKGKQDKWENMKGGKKEDERDSGHDLSQFSKQD